MMQKMEAIECWDGRRNYDRAKDRGFTEVIDAAAGAPPTAAARNDDASPRRRRRWRHQQDLYRAPHLPHHPILGTS